MSEYMRCPKYALGQESCCGAMHESICHQVAQQTLRLNLTSGDFVEVFLHSLSSGRIRGLEDGMGIGWVSNVFSAETLAYALSNPAIYRALTEESEREVDAAIQTEVVCMPLDLDCPFRPK